MPERKKTWTILVVRLAEIERQAPSDCQRSLSRKVINRNDREMNVCEYSSMNIRLSMDRASRCTIYGWVRRGNLNTATKVTNTYLAKNKPFLSMRSAIDWCANRDEAIFAAKYSHWVLSHTYPWYSSSAWFRHVLPLTLNTQKHGNRPSSFTHILPNTIPNGVYLLPSHRNI